MLQFLGDLYRRRQLRHVVKTLPHILRQRYHSAPFYTAGQVKTTAKLLKIRPVLLPYALAFACTEEEFLDAQQEAHAETYFRLRLEMARLFGIEIDNLNCKTATITFSNPVGNDHGPSPSVPGDPGGW